MKFFKRSWWSSPVPNMVQFKMNHPRRRMGHWRQKDLKDAIRERLHEQYGYTWDHMGRVFKPKPRVRYKLRLRRHYILYTTNAGHRYAAAQWVYMLLLASVFFLSSAPTEAQYASVSGSWDNVHIVDGRWLSPNRAAWDRPVVYKAYSQFEVKNTPVKWLFRPRIDTSLYGCKAFTQMQTKQAEYDALVNGPRLPRYDWRKFWTWFAAIGTIALALGSALLYGAFRSTK